MRASTSPSALALALGALLALLAPGCTSSTEPTRSSVFPETPAPADPRLIPAPPFPALPRPGVIYNGPDSLYDFASAYHGSRLASRYVLYPDGRFALQFSSLNFGFFEYRGRYSATASWSEITFDFDASNAAGPWAANGTLHGDSLSVTYNTVMMLADFMDGVYGRSP